MIFLITNNRRSRSKFSAEIYFEPTLSFPNIYDSDTIIGNYEYGCITSTNRHVNRLSTQLKILDSIASKKENFEGILRKSEMKVFLWFTDFTISPFKNITTREILHLIKDKDKGCRLELFKRCSGYHFGTRVDETHLIKPSDPEWERELLVNVLKEGVRSYIESSNQVMGSDDFSMIYLYLKWVGEI